MKRLLPVYTFLTVVLLSSCTKEIRHDVTNDAAGREVTLSGEQKAVDIFNNFLTGLDQNDPSTRGAASIPKIVGVNKTSSAAYGGRQSATRTSDDAMTTYELILENPDNTRGFAIVTDDPCYSEVIAYAPKGSLSDTTYIEGMAFYMRGLSELLAFIKEEGNEIAEETTRGEYWQDIGNGGWVQDGDVQTVQTFPSYQAFVNAGGHTDYPRTTPNGTSTWLGGIVNAKWRQEAPYNDQVPEWVNFPVERCRIGCAAIAMGQLMTFHRWPSRYNWTLITFSPEISVNAPFYIKNSVSSFLLDVALQADTKWNVIKNTGGAYSTDIAPTMQSFGYHINLIRTPSRVSADIYNDLMAGRPVLLGGQEPGSGPEPDAHIWVVDGLYREYRLYYYSYLVTNGGSDPVSSFVSAHIYRYRQRRSLIHCNWGWGDDSNGWYASMTPYYSRGGRTVNYNGDFWLWNNIGPSSSRAVKHI